MKVLNSLISSTKYIIEGINAYCIESISYMYPNKYTDRVFELLDLISKYKEEDCIEESELSLVNDIECYLLKCKNIIEGGSTVEDMKKEGLKLELKLNHYTNMLLEDYLKGI